jgi:hypothetical protein
MYLPYQKRGILEALAGWLVAGCRGCRWCQSLVSTCLQAAQIRTTQSKNIQRNTAQGELPTQVLYVPYEGVPFSQIFIGRIHTNYFIYTIRQGPARMYVKKFWKHHFGIGAEPLSLQYRLAEKKTHSHCSNSTLDVLTERISGAPASVTASFDKGCGTTQGRKEENKMSCSTCNMDL